jgi:hypothetical protein
MSITVNWINSPWVALNNAPADGVSFNYLTLRVDAQIAIKIDITPVVQDLTFWPNNDWQNAYPEATISTNEDGFLAIYITSLAGQQRDYTLSFSSGDSGFRLPSRSVTITFGQPAASPHAPLQVKSLDYPAPNYLEQPLPILCWPTGGAAAPLKLNVQGDQSANASITGTLSAPSYPDDGALGSSVAASSDGQGNLTINPVPTQWVDGPMLLTLRTGTGETGGIWVRGTYFGDIYLDTPYWPVNPGSPMPLQAYIEQLAYLDQGTFNPSGLTLEWVAGDEESQPYFYPPRKVTTDRDNPSTFQYQTKPISTADMAQPGFHITAELRIYDPHDNYFSVKQTWGQDAPPPQDALTIVPYDGDSICVCREQTTTRTVKIFENGQKVPNVAFTGSFYPQGSPDQAQPLTLLNNGASNADGLLSFNAFPGKSGNYVLSLNKWHTQIGGHAGFTARVLSNVSLQADPATVTSPLNNGATLTANITDDSRQQYPGGLVLQWEAGSQESGKFFRSPQKVTTRQGDTSSFQYQTNPISADDIQHLPQLDAKLEIFADATSIAFTQDVPFKSGSSLDTLTITLLDGSSVVAVTDAGAPNATPLYAQIAKQGVPQGNLSFEGSLTLEADGSDAGTVHVVEPLTDQDGKLTVIALATVQGQLQLRLTNTLTQEYGTHEIDATVLQSISITPDPAAVSEPQPDGMTFTANIVSFLGQPQPDGLMLAWAGGDDASQKFFDTKTVTTRHNDPKTFQCQTNPILQADLSSLPGIQAQLQVHATEKAYFTMGCDVPFAQNYSLLPPVFTLNDEDYLDDNAWLAAEKDGDVPFWIPPINGTPPDGTGSPARIRQLDKDKASQPRLNLWGYVPPNQPRIIMASQSLSDDDMNNGVESDVSLEHSLFQVNQLIGVYYEVSGPKINLSRSQTTWVHIHREATEPQYPGSEDPNFLTNATPRQYLKKQYEDGTVLSVDVYIPRGATPEPGDIVSVYLDLAGYTEQNGYEPQPRLQLKPYSLTEADIDQAPPGLPGWVKVTFGDLSGSKAGFTSEQLADVKGCTGNLYFSYQKPRIPTKDSKGCPVIIDVTAEAGDIPMHQGKRG